MSDDVEVVEVPGGTVVELAYEPTDPLVGAAVVSVTADGPATAAAASDSWVTSRLASSIMSGHRLVVPTSTGSVEYADNQIAAHRARPIWLTLAAVLSGARVPVLLAGSFADPSWSWTPGPLYLGLNGVLTQALPAAPGFLAQVGYATSPTSIYLDRQPSVVLAP